MANKTITQLSPLTPSSTSQLAIYGNGSTGKTTVQQVLNTNIPGLGSENGTSVKNAINELTSDLLYADDPEESEEVDFTTQDETQNPEIQTVEKLVGTDSWSNRFVKISKMFQNIRYILKTLGTTDISNISTEGTVTGALSALNNKKIQYGYFEVSVPSNNYVEYTLQFSEEFPTIPSIVAMPVIWANPDNYSICIRSRFQISGTFRISNNGTSTMTVGVNWIAIGDRS